MMNEKPAVSPGPMNALDTYYANQQTEVILALGRASVPIDYFTTQAYVELWTSHINSKAGSALYTSRRLGGRR